MVIAKAINYRSDGVKYPINPPVGWVFMALAVDDFCGLALEEGGSYRDFAWADANIPKQNSALDQINAETQLKARRRRPRIVRAFNKVLVSGEVRAGYSTIGGGAVVPMEPDLWRTDDPLLRFRTFSFDPANPFSDRVDLPCWIWMESISLRRAADRLYRERMGWGALPEPPPLPRTERHLRDDGKIEVFNFRKDGSVDIQVEDARPAKGKAGRPSKTTRTMALFGDHLRNGTVAERVQWEGAAISNEYGGDHPPKPDTCADRIRPFFNMILRDQVGNIINAGEVLEAMQFPINPDKSRSTAIN